MSQPESPFVPFAAIAHAYCRVSTERQHQSTLGIREQVRKVIVYADMNRFDLGAPTIVDIDGSPFESRERVIIEPESAFRKKFMERPGGSELCGKLYRGEQVIFAKLDRGFRKASDALKMLERWEKQGIGVHFIDMSVDTTKAIGKMMITILAAFAELESAYRSERVLDSVRARRERRFESMIRGDCPYLGFRFINPQDKPRRKMVPDESQRWILDLFYEMYSVGWSDFDIVDFARKKRILRYDQKFFDRYDVRAGVLTEHGMRQVELEFRAKGHTPTYEEVATTWLAKFIQSGGSRQSITHDSLACAKPGIPRVSPLLNPGLFPVPDRKKPKWEAFK